MSRLKPDFEPLENSAFFFRPNTAIQAEINTPETPASLTELKEIIRKFSLSLTPDDQKKLKHATLTAKTCAFNRDSAHYWQLIKEIFIQSLKETHPEQDRTAIIEVLNSVNLSLFSKEHVDNVSFLVYLLGIINGLL